MKTFLLLSLTLTVTLGVPVPEWEPVAPLAVDEVLPLSDVLPEQGHVVQEDIKPDAGLEKVQEPADLSPIIQKEPAEPKTLAEVKAAPLDPVVEDKPAEKGPVAQDTEAQGEPAVEDPVEEPSVQEEVKEEVQYKSPDEQDLNSDLLPKQEPAVEENKDEPGMGLESVEEDDAIVQEVHPMLGRLRGMEEPTMELEPEEEEASMHGYLTEDEAEMVEQPEMELEPLPEEEPAMPEAAFMAARMSEVEEPTMELEPLQEEETSQDEPGTEGEPEEEEELMGEEGPVSVGETVVDVEESPEQETEQEQPVPLARSGFAEAGDGAGDGAEAEDETSQDEPGTEGEPAEEEELMGDEGPVSVGETVVDVEESPEQEEPFPLARSGFAEGPLMVGMTVKQAMMEEEPDMWVGPYVVGADPVQGMEEQPNAWPGVDEESAADMESDDRMIMSMKTRGNEETEFYADNLSQARSVDEELANEVTTERRSCGGVFIDGRCYQFFRGPKKAWDAEFFCQESFPNGHLASVTNSYIHQEMMNQMAQNGGYTRTWIGGLRYLDTGRFIWLDGAHWDYADWLAGEPNNTAGKEDCVELLSDSKFNDMPCWDLRAYICSYPL